MIETVLSGLILASISALSFIAYKHPKGYARIHFWVVGLIWAAYIITGVSDVSYHAGFSHGSIQTMKLNQTDVIADTPKTIPVYIHIVICVATIFLLALRNLPSLLDLKESEKKGAQKDP